MILFMTATFATKSQAGINEPEKFGFPFTFFTAVNNGDLISETSFSVVALLVNFILCLLIAFAIVSVLSLLKVERKKALMV